MKYRIEWEPKSGFTGHGEWDEDLDKLIDAVKYLDVNGGGTVKIIHKVKDEQGNTIYS